MKWLFLVLLVGCGDNVLPPPQNPNVDTSKTCADALQNSQKLNCPGTGDAQSWMTVCRRIQNVQYVPCVAAATSCAVISSCDNYQ
jgi:hypothetical protein